jgi:hypothetical protein
MHLWQTGRVEPELFVGDALDPILPVNLIVRATPSPPVAGTPLSLTPETVRQQQVAPGSQVTLSGFVVTEVDQAAGELTLDLPESGGPLPARYRLRVKDMPDLTPFQPGHALPHSLTGMVQTTRLDILQDNARQAFDGAVDVTADPLTLPGLDPLPNPLLALPQILNRTADMRIGPIHGDLNLENILVESDRKSHIVHLIDFANARQDWVLHDLWRLETGFWLYLAAREMQENGWFAGRPAPYAGGTAQRILPRSGRNGIRWWGVNGRAPDGPFAAGQQPHLGRILPGFDRLPAGCLKVQEPRYRAHRSLAQAACFGGGGFVSKQ